MLYFTILCSFVSHCGEINFILCTTLTHIVVYTYSYCFLHPGSRPVFAKEYVLA